MSEYLITTKTNQSLTSIILKIFIKIKVLFKNIDIKCKVIKSSSNNKSKVLVNLST